MTTYTVHYGDPAQGEQAAIGQLSYGPGGQLAVLSAEADREAFLRDVVSRTNQLDKLHETVRPGPGSARHTITKRPVERHDPRFRAALKEYLQRYYLLQLVAEGPEPDETVAAGPTSAPGAEAGEEAMPSSSRLPADFGGAAPEIDLAVAEEPTASEPPEAETMGDEEPADEPAAEAEPAVPDTLPKLSVPPARSAIDPAKRGRRPAASGGR